MIPKLATRLLRGSLALDRMTEEIKLIIQILTGWLNSGDLIDEEKILWIDRPYLALWRVGRYATGKRAHQLYFLFEVKGGGEDEFWIWYHSVDLPTPKVQYVRRVREALEALVEMLADKYPDMRRQWEPIFQAAEPEVSE